MADATADDVLAGRALSSVEQGDCLDFLNRLPADSVDLLVTSPPYDCARTYSVNFDKYGQSWSDWMVAVVRAALRVCKGAVVVVCQGQTRDFAWTGSPVLLMADLLRTGVTLRRPVIYRRDSIPGSGGEDYLRMSWEFAVVATRGGKLPWADPTACGAPPKWGPGGRMSNRLANGRRVNQWGHAMESACPGTRLQNGERDRNLRPSHVETVIGPADDAPCLPGLEAPPEKRPLRNAEGHKCGTPRKVTSGADGSVELVDGKYYAPPVLANPGDVVSHLYTQAEVDALLAAYQGSDVCDVGAVGGGRMGSKLAHANEAPFPEDLAAFFVRTFCPPGGVVLDCFAGSGTTLAVAVQWGRRAIGCDLRGPEQPDPRHDMVTLSRRRLAGVVPPLPAQDEPAPEPFPLPEPSAPPPEPCLPGLEGLLKPAPTPHPWGGGATSIGRHPDGTPMKPTGKAIRAARRKGKPPVEPAEAPAPEETDNAR